MKKRKDSISGQLRLIGRIRNWRRQSLQGLGFFTRRANQTNLNFNENFEDIALIEQLVNEQVKFDWERFERLRKESQNSDPPSTSTDKNIKLNSNQKSPLTSKLTTDKINEDDAKVNVVNLGLVTKSSIPSKGLNEDFTSSSPVRAHSVINQAGSSAGSKGTLREVELELTKNGDVVLKDEVNGNQKGNDNENLDDDKNSIVALNVEMESDSDESESEHEREVEEGEEDDDNSIVEVGNIDSDGKSLEEEVVAKISDEGKEKLRFIMEFATKCDNSNDKNKVNVNSSSTSNTTANSTLRRANLRTLKKKTMKRNSGSKDTGGILRLRTFSDDMSDTMSIHSMSSTLSQPPIFFNNISNPETPNSGFPMQKSSSMFSKLGALKPQLDSENINNKNGTTRNCELSREALCDEFSRYKGFQSQDHMNRYFERVRGFEELKVETQIDMMARESGYRPSRNSRNTSVLSFLETDEDYKKLTKDVGEGEENVTDDDEAPEEDEEIPVSEDEDTDISGLCDFMNYEGDDDDLADLAAKWDQVKGFNSPYDTSTDDELDEAANMNKKSKRRSYAKNKRFSRPREREKVPLSIVKKDTQWIEKVKKKQEEEQDAKLFQTKRRVYDSLTSSQFKHIKFT